MVAVLVVALGLLVLAQGALALAGRELAASRLEARLVGRRLAARSAVAFPVLGDTLPQLSWTPRVLASGSHGPYAWRTEAQRLGSEIGLLTGVAREDHLPREARTGVVVWAMNPTDRVAAAEAVIETAGGAELEGLVTTTGFLDPPEPSATGMVDGSCLAKERPPQRGVLSCTRRVAKTSAGSSRSPTF